MLPTMYSDSPGNVGRMNAKMVPIAAMYLPVNNIVSRPRSSVIRSHQLEGKPRMPKMTIGCRERNTHIHTHTAKLSYRRTLYELTALYCTVLIIMSAEVRAQR